jgi:thioester reductase-like protein
MSSDLTVLLTGATGLVGRYLLAALLRRRIPVLAIVRSHAHRHAAHRIDEALAPLESECLLPRPGVLEGNLTVPGLGIDPRLVRQLAGRPLRIVHCAASIRFNAESQDGEPYATNVQGTQNLLDLASQLHVVQFHHVSTAYVQCDRQPGRTLAERTAYERPVSSDLHAGNDYERSKIQAERLVTNCRHVGTTNIYRPSIVVGDWMTGYTSTYHGFYAPLQVAAGLVRLLGLDVAAADSMRRHLGLESHDSKNLVPVDWLAASIVHLMECPAALGGIYHLTHPQPALLADMQAASDRRAIAAGRISTANVRLRIVLSKRPAF